MKGLLLFVISFCCLPAWCQVIGSSSGPGVQEFNKDITEYRVKDFIVREILQIPDRQTVEVQIGALTASKSGELSTAIFECKALKRRGLIFGFWSSNINQYNTLYVGNAFKYFDFDAAKELLDELERVLDEKKAIISNSEDVDMAGNAVYRYGDMTFIFYKGGIGSNLIRVLWNNFDSEWNQSNLKTLKRRFYRNMVNEK